MPRQTDFARWSPAALLFFAALALAFIPIRQARGIGGPILYSIGQPTNEEQLYLEYINRARADPAAEGMRLATTTDASVRSAYTAFGVNLTVLQAQFAALPAKPPLSLNTVLTQAARKHSQDMLTHNFQSHTGSDGSTPGTRLAAYLSGAPSAALAENIFAYAQSVWYGHAAFEVDWGAGANGMQSPPGHRQNIHGDYREIGIGVSLGRNGSVGPQLVTQDFGTRGDLKPFVTGVVYRDTNGNGFYDAGEGIGGVSVSVSGSNYAAVSANSGGYSVPVPGNGSYVVNFSGAAVSNFQRNVAVVGSNNVKVDYAVVATTATLHNVSTRAYVGAGDSVMIGGIIITGSGSKEILVRALGPSLEQFGVTGALSDPVIELHDSSGAVIAANDNWMDGPNAAAIDPSLRPAQPSEAAILTTVTPGKYTVTLRGANLATGTALLETYDLDSASASELTNISTRGPVQTGDRVMIAGFIVSQGSKTVVVRALGPTLSGFGVANSLADPTLELRDGNGTLLMTNDNWKAAQQAELSASGYAPPSDAEPAMLTTLPAGNYTAIVRGVNSSTGVALVEVYDLP